VTGDLWWPCHECGGRGVRNLGTRGYCSAHLSELYSRFDPTVFRLRGVGLQAGQLRPDYGEHYADLQCCACGATWVGVTGERCWWCQRSHQIMCDYQAELVVRRPEIDPSDARYQPAMKAWAERMVIAIKAGVIRKEDADRVWRRAVQRAA
jgi:hypothetical protein